jgi:hypothetical protein
MMSKSRAERNEVDLRCIATTPMPDRHERGPLVADDHGISVVTGRKRLRRTDPIHYYFFAWSDVVGYRLRPGVGSESNSRITTAAQNTELTIYTRRGQHSWAVPLTEAKVRILLGRWLARFPSRA